MMSEVVFEKKTPKGILKIFNDHPKTIKFLGVTQVHGDIISKNKGNCEADGLIITEGHHLTPLGIKTADCIPLLIEGKNGFGMLHVGWRGLQQEIHLKQEIDDLSPQYFFIGPHISSLAFEVTKEFYTHFPKSHDCFQENQGRITFNMSKKIQQDLKERFPRAIVEDSSQCTHQLQQYNSYRRDKTERRNWNIYFPSSL